MRLVLLLTFFTLLAWNVQAGVVTMTLPWDQGDTIIVSMTTNANGVAQTATVSTLTSGAAADATTSKSTTAKTTTAAAATKTSSTKATTTGTSTQTTTSATIATTVLTASGVTVTIESGTTMDYAAFSSIVAPSLEAAYSATASSSALRQSGLSSFPVVLSVCLAVVGGAFGGIGLFI
ncbi:hypothetical protein [Phaffia rhodozyma]|uniref:Uncharacterized protein n=1 Tax=Phaffia rhodozyma TaxID=264483 RepID=A0A0F7SFD3_PHARH|nr:hypothetical protein [Phaffia rhodozyma]